MSVSRNLQTYPKDILTQKSFIKVKGIGLIIILKETDIEDNMIFFY
jgi:hypothetical protein